MTQWGAKLGSPSRAWSNDPWKCWLANFGPNCYCFHQAHQINSAGLLHMWIPLYSCRVVAHLKLGGDRDTLLMQWRAIVHSKLEYGCIVYGTASYSNLWQLDSIHNSGLRLALGAFCISPIFSLYTEANETPLEERRLKLSMHYYMKTRACIDNPAHHTLHEFDRTIKHLYAPAKWERRHDPTPDPCHWSQGRGGHGLCRDQWWIGLPPGYTQLAFHQEHTITTPRDTTSLKE